MNATLKRISWLLSITLPALLFQARSAAAGGQPVQFSRDILPILSENCFQCHGPDEKARKAHLRLDVPDCLHAEAKSGQAVIAPKKPADSELVARILSTDAAQMMPPPRSNRKFS